MKNNRMSVTLSFQNNIDIGCPVDLYTDVLTVITKAHRKRFGRKKELFISVDLAEELRKVLVKCLYFRGDRKND
jgi:hypothetical protein